MSKEAIKYITATLAAFGPDEAISMTKETWAKLREAIKTLAEQPAQQEPKFSARDDAERLKSVGRGMSYNDAIEAVWKHTLMEIAMRLETGGYTPAPAQQKPVAVGSLDSLKLPMQHSAWEGVIQLSDALQNIDDFAKEQPPQRKPLTDEQPVSNSDELPSGFVPLQKQNGRLVYAACMDSEARHYKWLMWRHPDGQWVSKRKLEDCEVMQVEDQQHYGIVQEAAHNIKENT